MEILSGHMAYAEILLAIFVPVAAISFLTPFSRVRRYRPLIVSIAAVAPVYILWDELAVVFGTWKFDPAHVLGIYFFYIPVEEVAFFLVVPFSTLLIFEALDNYVKGTLPCRGTVAAASISIVLLVILGVLNTSRSYTSVASFFSAGSLALGLIVDRRLLVKKSLWAFLVVSYIPFVFFDHLMVTAPIFTYGRGAITGIRVAGIPVEEFEYVFSLLLNYAVAYDVSARFLSSRRASEGQ
ncbi:hypothetical protein GCM10007108_11470 [Thermogymnomonas acidicola]|uniref:Lycopene cyclase domain-containing protein n=1 Tax=Thermogymnomonas acidicola TaxID=399579 RepID=A0AA37BS66_9ARCH|nr:lycopene cyclase domain-containing protein [Thermogymnomonas acidicola]GGM75250.1 hypothetical protein GCM10007108_11470 [Thermogymnomonas acidicola]